MNYEQKYKEALERAKEFKSPYCQHAAEVIFPELKENEDEKIRKGLIKGLFAMRDIHHHQTFSDDAINIDDAIAWLEKQGEQSWSEEDEKMLNKIINELTPYGECPDYPSPEEQEYYYTRQEMIDWLKSLKPRWKPTEEQMEALKYFISFHRPQANAAVEGWKEFKNLESLYNDLKSL